MILITGAGGKTGRTLIRALASHESVCALVHHEAQAALARSLGAEHVVVGDLRDKDTIRSAMQNARALYHICPNMNPDELQIGELLIDMARQADVSHFVYHSVLHPQTEKMHHHWQKLHVEEALFESGLSFTILQPAPYMQNLLAGWKNILENGIFQVPYSIESKFSFVDLEDIAEAAKIVLTEPGHANAVYELVGTTPVSHKDAAQIFSQVLGRDVHAEKEEIRDWRLRSGELSPYAEDNLIKMFEYYDQWGLVGNPNVLRWVLKREPTSLESFIQRALREYDSIH